MGGDEALGLSAKEQPLELLQLMAQGRVLLARFLVVRLGYRSFHGTKTTIPSLTLGGAAVSFSPYHRGKLDALQE